MIDEREREGWRKERERKKKRRQYVFGFLGHSYSIRIAYKLCSHSLVRLSHILLSRFYSIFLYTV